RNPCRIFINVKCMIEMRNTQAFKIELGIEHEVFCKVSFEQRVIFRFKEIKRQRVAAFLNGVNNLLELSKHGLPVKCAPQVVDLPVNDVGAHLRVVRCFEQVMGEQFLVKC